MSDKHEIITTLALKTFTVIMPETVGTETVTVKLIRVSNSFTWDFTLLLFENATQTGNMTFVSDSIWKQSFTPPADGEYVAYIYDSTNTLAHYISFSSETAPEQDIVLVSPDTGTHYCSNAQVALNVPVLASSAVSDQHLAMADNLINSKLAGLYTLPFSATPPLINSIAISLASYYALTSKFMEAQQNNSEWVKGFYDKAIYILDEIIKGKIELVTSANVLIARADTDDIKSNTQDYHLTFGEDAELNQTQDEDKLDDLESGRE
jgi:phage gp36-like protein